MDSLPPELILHIARHVATDLDVSTLLNFRLTCKAFAAAGTKYLTTTVFFSRFPKDLRMLRDISQHSGVSKQITNAICDDSDFSQWRLEDDYADELPEKSCKEFFRQMCQEQLHAKQQGFGLAVLCVALLQMPNLKRILITDFFESYRGPQTSPAWVPPCDHDSCSPERWPLHASSENLWDQGVSPYNIFVTVIRGLSLTNHEIHELVVEGDEAGLSHRIFHTDSEDTVHLFNVFKSLRSIKLKIATHRDEDLWREKTVSSGLLSSALGKAIHLESLELQEEDIENEEWLPPLFDFSLALGQTIWTFLRHFSLTYFKLHGNSGFITFLIAHNHTLESVYLTSLEMVGDQWSATFEGLRRGKVEWTRCEIWNLSQDDHELNHYVSGTDAMNYLRDGGPNPFE